QIAFVDGARHLPLCLQSEASALIVPPDVEIEHKPFIVTEDPRLAFSKVLALFATDRKPDPGVHPTAVLGSNVHLGRDVSIGANSYVGDDAIIGDRTIIHPLAYVAHEVTIGEDTEIYPQTYIGPRAQLGSRVIVHAGATVGADGFGFLQTAEGHHKIPQIGNVIVEDDVEIGANTTVDRATVSATVIGAGTKIDDGVHVAHNVVIGRNCLLCGQVGVAGSVKIGDNVVMGGQVGIKDHVEIGANVILAAGAKVMGSIDQPGIYSGSPARNHRELMRMLALAYRLPETMERLKELERTVEELQAQLKEKEQDR
ncbi:MAG TPA: UDP-3-O-(3-hydroxymyristoyl)glucosamine N-acyltransferase, partial [Armatimonadota bacterium]|nr:UDP-3-O-(3-hydroxymyristoyl)glucosamine N-acyltransferase [Armatimonadota bacterium]